MPAEDPLAPEVLENAMLRALALAARGPAADENPQVGCVVLDEHGATVAEGWHMGAGTPHAEAVALAALPDGLDPLRLTAVVTLEPCNHTGRTGPCAEALVRAGIGAVAFGLADPGSESGRGAATLAAAGVRVLGGVRSAEVREFLALWLSKYTEANRA